MLNAGGYGNIFFFPLVSKGNVFGKCTKCHRTSRIVRRGRHARRKRIEAGREWRRAAAVLRTLLDEVDVREPLGRARHARQVPRPPAQPAKVEHLVMSKMLR